MGLLEILDHRLCGTAQDEPINQEQSRSLPTSRLPVTNPANFLEPRFWIVSELPTIPSGCKIESCRAASKR